MKDFRTKEPMKEAAGGEGGDDGIASPGDRLDSAESH